MMEPDNADIMNKLELVKDIRHKTLQLEKLKTQLKKEVSVVEGEEKCVEEYRQEMELLLQEKMAHVEELRLIHADINLLESTIKQADEDRNKSLENAKTLYSEYGPLKEQVDQMLSSIGLECLPDLKDEPDNFSPDFLEKPKLDLFKNTQDLEELPSHIPHPFLLGPSTSAAIAQTHFHHNPQAQQQQQHFHQHHMQQLSKVIPPSGPPRTPPTANSAAASVLRQQPPPMKACLSCHQQIHRNAPICPLCKAKSRSRNPKKPKRKLDE